MTFPISHKRNKHKVPFVSVIIPVFNDEQRLKLCLASLENQTYSINHYEIIVIDNNSEQPIEIDKKLFPHVCVVKEMKTGSYAARNKGIVFSKGEILAFTDSDCIPDAEWIESGVSDFQSVENLGILGGHVEIFYRDSNNPTIEEIYEKKSAFPQKKYITKHQFSVTANMFTHRGVINTVGDFDENLRSGGDQEWGKRVSEAGYSLIYSDKVIVKHPARASIDDLLRKTIRQTSGLLDIDELKKSTGHFSYKVYLNWLAYILPSPRIIFSILFDKDISISKRMDVLGFSLLIKLIRLKQLVRLIFKLDSKAYD